MLLVKRLGARPGVGAGPWPCWCERKDPYKRALLNEWRTPINGLPRVNGGPYKRVSSSEWLGSGAFAVSGSRDDQETAPPKPGCAQPCPLVLLTPGGKTGCLGNTGRPSRVFSLNPASGALQGRTKFFPTFSWDKKRILYKIK